MDELKLHTAFMRNMVSKLISRALFKKTGYKIDIQFNEVKVENKDGRIYLHADVSGEMETNEFKKIFEEMV